MAWLCETYKAGQEQLPASGSMQLTIGNPAETIRTPSGPVTLYIPEFSRPTGRYVNKLMMRVLNGLVRRGSIAMAGNPCTPGLGMTHFGETDPGPAMLKSAPHRTVVVNYPGTPSNSRAIIFPAEPFMHLNIRPEWGSFDDYLNAMSSKYRVRTRKVFAESAELTSETLSGYEIPAEMFGIMAGLLGKTLARKTLALPPDLRKLLFAFSRQYGNQFEVEIYRYNGEIVGFLSRIYLGNEVHAMHIGYESGHAREWHLYQRMMYDLIGSAISKGAKLVNLGRTATEIKSTLGAVAMENSFAVYSSNLIIRAGLKMYRKYFFRPKPYTLRNPFKA